MSMVPILRKSVVDGEVAWSLRVKYVLHEVGVENLGLHDDLPVDKRP
jgi:hypothetical protein